MKIIYCIYFLIVIQFAGACNRDAKAGKSIATDRDFSATDDSLMLSMSNASYEKIGGIKFYLKKNHNDVILDSLVLFDVAEVFDTVELCNKVWKIRFRVNGGTGVTLRRTIIVIAKNNQLFNSLDVISDMTSNEDDKYSNGVFEERPNKRKIENQSRFKCFGNATGFQLSVKLKTSKFTNEKLDSLHSEEKEYYFNADKNVFFNSNDLFTGEYTLSRGKISTKVVMKDELIPIIDFFKGDKYLFYNGSWFMESNTKNRLIEMY